jgi:hypothetical protein
MTVFERMMFLAKGGRIEYLHGKKENVKTTRLQDFLSDYMVRNDIRG